MLKSTVPCGVVAPVPLISVTVAVQDVAVLTDTGFGVQDTEVLVACVPLEPLMIGNTIPVPPPDVIPTAKQVVPLGGQATPDRASAPETDETLPGLPLLIGTTASFPGGGGLELADPITKQLVLLGQTTPPRLPVPTTAKLPEPGLSGTTTPLSLSSEAPPAKHGVPPVTQAMPSNPTVPLMEVGVAGPLPVMASSSPPPPVNVPTTRQVLVLLVHVIPEKFPFTEEPPADRTGVTATFVTVAPLTSNPTNSSLPDVSVAPAMQWLLVAQAIGPKLLIFWRSVTAPTLPLTIGTTSKWLAREALAPTA